MTRSFSIGKATGVFTNLVNPPIVLSTLFTTLNGRLGPAGLTTGATVTVTFGSQTRSATVAADGSFSAQFLTLLLPPSPGLPVAYSFAGSATVTAASAASVVPVLYAQSGNCVGDPGHVVLPPLNPSTTVQVKKNSTVPVRFRVCNAFHLPVGWIPVVSHFYFMGNTAGATTPVSETHRSPVRLRAPSSVVDPAEDEVARERQDLLLPDPAERRDGDRLRLSRWRRGSGCMVFA